MASVRNEVIGHAEADHPSLPILPSGNALCAAVKSLCGLMCHRL
jgi:hypothetical protein